jgi:hypothetical protein
LKAAWDRDDAFMAVARVAWPDDVFRATRGEGYRRNAARSRLKLRHEGFRSAEQMAAGAERDRDSAAVGLAEASEYIRHLLGSLKGAGAEIARLRARVRVEAEDVVERGVRREHVVAWLQSNGWEPSADGGWNGATGPFTVWRPIQRDGRGVSVHERDSIDATVDAVQTLADRFNRPGLDILDEIAAMTLATEGS